MSTNDEFERKARTVMEISNIISDELSSKNYVPSDFLMAIPFMVAMITRKLSDQEFMKVVKSLYQDMIDARSALAKGGVISGKEDK